MRRLIAVLVVTLLVGYLPAQAANIHLHFFESVDSFLTEERFQRYSFQALEEEKITIVAYGLENDTIPMLTVFDTIGSTLVENPNEEGLSAAAVQFTAVENGIYTFLVSRQTDEGGLVRVMIFEGDPIKEDRTLQDTVDPLLPARAFLFAGDETDPVEISISVIDDDDPDTPTPEIYASRGTDIELPPLEERTTPIQSQLWENTDPERLYTVNVRASPEPVAHLNGYLSYGQQTTGPIQFGIQSGEGGEPEMVVRPICQARVLETVQSFGGPSAEDYDPASLFQAGQEIEIVGMNGLFYLIVDPDSETGGSWIPMASIEFISIPDSVDCSRVVEVEAPPVPQDETPPSGFTPPSNTGNNQPADATTDEEETAPPQGDNWCHDPARWGDGRCNSGTQEQNDWHWRCGYFMAQFEKTNDRSVVPADCTIVLPPTPIPPEPAGGGSFPGGWSGCIAPAMIWEAYATYTAPPGAVSMSLVTNYGTTSSPVTGTIVHNTGQSYITPIVVTGTLVAYDSFGGIIGTLDLGALSC